MTLPIPDDPRTQQLLGEEAGRWWAGLDLAHRLHARFLMLAEEKATPAKLEPKHSLILVENGDPATDGRTLLAPSFMCFEHGPDCTFMAAIREAMRATVEPWGDKDVVIATQSVAVDEAQVALNHTRNRITRAETLMMTVRKKLEAGTLKPGSEVWQDIDEWLTQS